MKHKVYSPLLGKKIQVNDKDFAEHIQYVLNLIKEQIYELEDYIVTFSGHNINTSWIEKKRAKKILGIKEAK